MISQSSTRPVITEHHTSYIGVNIGCDIWSTDITAGYIRYHSLLYHINSDIIIPDITITSILLRACRGGPDKGLITPTLEGSIS